MDFRSGLLESFSLLSMCSSPVARAAGRADAAERAPWRARGRAKLAGARAPEERVELPKLGSQTCPS